MMAQTEITISSPEMQRPVSAQFREGLIMNFGPHLMQVKNSQLLFFTNSGAEATSPLFTYQIVFSEPILAAVEQISDEASGTAALVSANEIQLTTRLGKEPKLRLELAK